MSRHFNLLEKKRYISRHGTVNTANGHRTIADSLIRRAVETGRLGRWSQVVL